MSGTRPAAGGRTDVPWTRVAAAVNSALTTSEERETSDEIAAGEHPIVHVTPERLEDPDDLALLGARRGAARGGRGPLHLAVRSRLPVRVPRPAGRDPGPRPPPVLAVTATAPPEAARDILVQLGIEGALVVDTGARRDDLTFKVYGTVDHDARRASEASPWRTPPGAPAGGASGSAT